MIDGEGEKGRRQYAGKRGTFSTLSHKYKTQHECPSFRFGPLGHLGSVVLGKVFNEHPIRGGHAESDAWRGKKPEHRAPTRHDKYLDSVRLGCATQSAIISHDLRSHTMRYCTAQYATQHALSHRKIREATQHAIASHNTRRNTLSHRTMSDDALHCKLPPWCRRHAAARVSRPDAA
jgi:hypothetical protein